LKTLSNSLLKVTNLAECVSYTLVLTETPTNWARTARSGAHTVQVVYAKWYNSRPQNTVQRTCMEICAV